MKKYASLNDKLQMINEKWEIAKCQQNERFADTLFMI